MRIKDARRRYGAKVVEDFPRRVSCPVAVQRRIARSAARTVCEKRLSWRRLKAIMQGCFSVWRKLEQWHGTSGFRERLFRRAAR
jgi:hypothetical protein